MGWALVAACLAALLGWMLYQKRLPASGAARPPAPARSSLPPPRPEPRPPIPPASSAPVREAPQGPATPANANPFLPPAPPRVTGFPRPVNDVLEAQIALVQHGISAGPVDGIAGTQTAAAFRAFQRSRRLPPSGRLTPETRARLIIDGPPTQTYVVTSNDLARLQPLSPTWLGKSRQSRLDYETLLELVAEKHRASQKFIRRQNPDFDWAHARPGARVIVPRVMAPTNNAPAAFLRIHLAERTLQAFDHQSNLVAHFPCSIARRVDKRPIGRLTVQVVSEDPNYTFNPAIFPESAEGRRLGRKLVLPPGPNNPVGVAWIGLSRPAYGIHGTPVPEHVGRTESHGCFRLANWDARYLLRLVRRGTPVFVDP